MARLGEHETSVWPISERIDKFFTGFLAIVGTAVLISIVYSRISDSRRQVNLRLFGEETSARLRTNTLLSVPTEVDVSVLKSTFLEQKSGDVEPVHCGLALRSNLTSASCRDQVLSSSIPWTGIKEIETDADKIEIREIIAKVFSEHQCAMSEAKHCGIKFLRYSCPNTALCGGFGDRIRGIITAFLQGFLTNSFFFIDNRKPISDEFFFLRDYCNKQFMRWLNQCKAVSASIDWILIDGSLEASRNLIKEWENKSFIDSRSNGYPYKDMWQNEAFKLELQMRGLDWLPFEAVSSAIISNYFKKPTPLMQRKINSIDLLTSEVCGMGKHVVHVGMQIRTGGNKLLFSDATGRLQKSLEETVHMFRDEAIEFCIERNSDCCIFFTADDKAAFDLMADKVSVSLHQDGTLSWGSGVYEGTRVHIVYNHEQIMHLDRSSKSEGLFDQTLKMYTDWYILAYRMDFLLISRSGFGETAALANMTDRKVLVGGKFVTWDYY